MAQALTKAKQRLKQKLMVFLEKDLSFKFWKTNQDLAVKFGC